MKRTVAVEQVPAILRPRGIHRLYRNSRVAKLIGRHFNRLYYYRIEDTIFGTTWMGYPVAKYPTDLWVYQEMLHGDPPDLVIETGTFRGGSALFVAALLDQIGSGEVITIDVEHRDDFPLHPRITYITGSSTDPAVVEQVRERAADAKRVHVLLDSDHSRDHVLAEMRAYCDFVHPGGYLVVEDTNVNGNPVLPNWGPGPAEAVEEFTRSDSRFVVDPDAERFMLTAHPAGFLRRVG